MVHQDDTDILARIIIVLYNSADVIEPCLEALKTQTDKRFEIVIIDNACPQNSGQIVSDFTEPPERMRLIKENDNLGFAAGCNLGAKGAQTRWLITLNPDTIVQPDWFEQLCRSWDKRPDIEIWGCKQLRANAPEILDGFGDVFSIFGIAWRGGYGQPARLAPNSDVQIFGPCAAAAAYLRSSFEALGGFDPTFFCYLEDIDLAMRFNLSGRPAHISHKAIIHHIGSHSTQESPDFAMRQSYKNNPYLLIKNLPWIWLIICLPLYYILQRWILFRNRHDSLHGARISGHKQSRALISLALRNRRQIIRHKNASYYLARIICLPYEDFRKKNLFFREQK